MIVNLNPHFKTVIALMFAFLIVFFAMKNIDYSNVKDNFFDISLPLLLMSLFVFIMVLIAQSFRFKCLYPYAIKTIHIFIINLSSQSLNLVFPGQISGEVYKYSKLYKRSNSKLQTSFIIIMDRLVGFLSAILIALLSLILFKPKFLAEVNIKYLSNMNFTWNYWLFVFFGGGVLVLFYKHIVKQQIEKYQFKKWLVNVNWFNLIFFSVISLFFRVLRFYLLAQALHLHFNFVDAIFLLAFCQLSAFIPSLAGNIGVLEGIIIFSLMLLGIQSPDALIFALWNRISIVVIGLIGSLFLFYETQTTKHPI